MAVNIYKRIDAPWNRFCGNLDLQYLISGMARNYLVWKKSGFTADPYFRLYYPLKGEFSLEYTFGTLNVRPGGLYLIPPWIPFRFNSLSPCSHYWIHFISKQLSYLPSASRSLHLKLDQTASREYRKKIFRLLRLARRNLDMCGCIDLRMGLEDLLRPFMDIIQQKSSKGITHLTDLGRVIEYIANNFNHQIKIKDLSDLAGFSRIEFSRKFRAAFGMPPKQYISTRRISHAKNLLIETSMSVKEIAAQCGYENEFFFSRIFKEYEFRSPKEYRGLYKN